LVAVSAGTNQEGLAFLTKKATEKGYVESNRVESSADVDVCRCHRVSKTANFFLTYFCLFLHSFVAFEIPLWPTVSKTTKELSSLNPVWCTKVGRTIPILTTRFSARKTINHTQRPTGMFLVSLAISNHYFFPSFVHDFSTPITSYRRPCRIDSRKNLRQEGQNQHPMRLSLRWNPDRWNRGVYVHVCEDVVFAELATYRTVWLVCSSGCSSLNAGRVQNPSHSLTQFCFDVALFSLTLVTNEEM
jgi:hypothetical protein